MKNLHQHLIIIYILIGSFLSACTRVNILSEEPPWKYADIRSLDEADAADPEMDLVAVYYRQSPANSPSGTVQIRLDFLDITFIPNCNVFIAFDTEAGGESLVMSSFPAAIDWDYLLEIPVSSDIQLYNDRYKPLRSTGISVFRDPLQDTMTVNLSNNRYINSRNVINFQVFTTHSGGSSPADSSSVISSIDSPPERAEVMLVFWNSFPAYSPAQALRRWDGAHTGPQGTRHGLFNLFKAVDDYSIPIILLDLKYPTSLSALDYVGGLDLIKSLIAKKLIILPDPQPILSYIKPISLPNQILHEEMRFIQNIAFDYDIPFAKSVFSIHPLPPIDSGLSRYSTIFLLQSAIPEMNLSYPVITLSQCAGHTIIPIYLFPYPHSFYDQTSTEGPVIPLRRALIANAIQNNQNTSPNPMVLSLGGEVPNSSWATADEADITFQYIINHPWIHVMGENDLIPFSSQNGKHCPPEVASQTMKSNLFDFAFGDNFNKEYPNDEPSSFAIQTLTVMTSPVFPDPPGLYELRQNYFDQAGLLLEADHWEKTQYSLSACSLDLNNDNLKECILSNEQFFLIINPSNGALEYAFFKKNDNFHEFIGSSSILATGLSSPETWNFTGGLTSDPSIIPGAFWSENQITQTSSSTNYLEFSSSLEKISYSLSSSRIDIYITNSTGAPYLIPLLFDPWTRFMPHWYNLFINGSLYKGENDFSWKYPDGSIIALEGNHKITIHSFSETYSAMGITENPDVDFPSGHFFPMPLMVCEIEASATPIQIHLSIR